MSDTSWRVSKENVEIVREANEAVMTNEAGRPDEAALNRLFDRDYELVSLLTGVEGRSYRGLDGYAQYRLDMADAWREWRMDVEELIDAGGDTVVAVVRFQARGRTSDVPVDARGGIVFTLRDERILRTHTYLNASDALAAAGLPESAQAAVRE